MIVEEGVIRSITFGASGDPSDWSAVLDAAHHTGVFNARALYRNGTDMTKSLFGATVWGVFTDEGVLRGVSSKPLKVEDVE
jgi:hypothetical protein